MTQFIASSTTNVYKVKSGVSLRCARSTCTGAYVSLLAPGKTDYIYILLYRLPPKKDYHVYIYIFVVPLRNGFYSFRAQTD